MAKKKQKDRRVYVLDTSVLIHDPMAIERIGDEAIVIPLGVIEELDRIKGNARKAPEVAAAARIVSRNIEKYRQRGSFASKNGIETDAGGRLHIDYSTNNWDNLPIELERSTDNRIILVALQWKQNKRYTHDVRILSQDTNLRIKADVCGVVAEEWRNDKLINRIDELYSGQVIMSIPSEKAGLFTTLATKKEIPLAELGDDYEILTEGYNTFDDLHPNHCCFIKTADDKKVCLAIFKKKSQLLRYVPKPITGNDPITGEIVPKNIEQAFFEALIRDPEIKLVSGVGKAGTGKTIIALRAANILAGGAYDRIHVWRPNIPLGEDMGFLPGDIEEKFSPFARPIINAFRRILRLTKPAEFKKDGRFNDPMRDILSQDQGYMTIEPINFIQGETIHSSIILVDEGQNTTPFQSKQIVTRVGEGSKMVITGDPWQVANQYLDATNNGLSHVVERLKGQELFGHILLTKGERSDLAEMAAELL